MRKRSFFTRFLSVAIVLAMLLTSFSLELLTSAAVYGIIEDDFSSPAATADLWTVQSSDNGSTIGTPAVKDGCLVAATGNSSITQISDAAWNKMVVTENRKLETVTFKVNPTIGGTKAVTSPVLYYNPETKDRVYLLFYKHSSLGWQISWGANGSDRLNNNFLFNSSYAFLKQNEIYLLINASYSYNGDALQKITIDVSYYGAENYAKDSYLGALSAALTFTGASTNNDVLTKAGVTAASLTSIGNRFKVGFMGGTSQENCEKIRILSARFQFTQSNEEVCEIFSDTYADILAKTESTVTTSDKQAVADAIEAYRALKDEQRQLLSSQYDKLMSLKRTIFKQLYGKKYNVINPVFDDFEGYETTPVTDIWTAHSLKSGAAPTTQASVVEHDDSHWFVTPVNQDVVAVVDDGLWLDRSLSSLDCDIFVPADAKSTSFPQNIYGYLDTAENSYVAFEYTRREGGFLIRFGFDSKHFTRSPGGTNAILSPADGWDNEKPMHVHIEYYIVSETQIRLVMTATQGALSAVQDFTMTCVGDYRYQQKGFKAGFCGVSMAEGRCYFDNVGFTFDLTDEDLANYFVQKYEDGILSKTEATVTAEDAASLQEAYETFDSLAFEGQQLLRAKKQQLDQLAVALEPSLQSYMDSYGALYYTDLSQIDHSYDTMMDNALEDYASLSDFGKLAACRSMLTALKKHLVNLVVVTGENYDPIGIDFEYDYFPFVENEVSSFTKNSSAVIVPDPTDPTGENHVLLGTIDKNETMFYVIRDELWPVSGQLKTLKFRFHYDGAVNSVARPWFVYNYIDSENYSMISLSGGATGRVQYRTVSGGEETGSKYVSESGKSDFSDWVEYSFTFTSVSISATVKFTGTDESQTFTLPYIPGGKIGYYMSSAYNSKSHTSYLDDIKMTFERGDFDANQNIDDLYVYYTGNSFQHVNDTLLISGEQIGNLVESLSIYRLSDNKGSAPAFIDSSDFETPHVGEAVVTAPSDFPFDDTKATDLPIIQRTKTSVKAILPSDLQSEDTHTGDGVYAVKILAKNSKQKILLINAPKLSFLSGDEGKISTVGSDLEIIGYNLCPTGKASDVTVAAKSVADQSVTYLPITGVKTDDMYYLKVSLPLSLAKGKYELFVHSGLGDALSWSAPLILTVADSPRDSWPKTVFRVSDFGAKGDGDANDTAAIINALNAAYKNGGGIVKFDSGVYRVEHTLPIPQKTVIQGNGVGMTTILWSAYKWQYDEARTLLSIVGNCEINGVNMHCTRADMFIYTNPVNKQYGRFLNVDYASQPNDNIYLTDVRIHSLWAEGYASDGGAGFVAETEMTNSELFGLLYRENTSNRLKLGHLTTNLRLKNVDIYNTGDNGHSGISGDYLHADGLLMNNWTTFDGFNATVTNLEGDAACISLQASHSYFADNYLHTSVRNNRELFTTDGGPKASDVKVRFIGDNPDLMEQYTGVRKTDEKTFAFVGSTPGTNTWTNYGILVVAGQGQGQLRRIASNDVYVNPDDKTRYFTFTVDRPFQVNPNRNSNQFVIDPRDSMIFSNCRLEQGNSGAIYGSGVNCVFDGYTFDACCGPSLTNRTGIIWYITFANFNCVNSQGYVHGEGFGGTAGVYQTGNSAIRIYAQTAPCSFGMAGIVLKNNDFGSYRVSLTMASQNGAMWDLIIENNIIGDREYAIDGGVAGMNGVLIKDNQFDVDGLSPYDSEYFRDVAKGNLTYNVQKSPKALIVTGGTPSAVPQKGDVNGDGKISLKDATLTKYYVLEMITVTDDQKARMDVNGDGEVTLRDANQIRRYVTDGIPFEDSDD